jgi:hypothetical protein
MMGFSDSELIGFLLKAFAIVLFSGLIAITFVSLKIKPLLTIVSVFLIAILTSFIAVKGFSEGGVEYLMNGGVFFGEIPFRVDALFSNQK